MITAEHRVVYEPINSGPKRPEPKKSDLTYKSRPEQTVQNIIKKFIQSRLALVSD